MPVSKHYGGHGREVMAAMTKEYGGKKGKQVFYATENKKKSVMGRKMIHHSPPKHPESTDPYAQMDKDLEKALQGYPSTMKQAREAMKPAQVESPKPAQSLMDYIKKFGGSR